MARSSKPLVRLREQAQVGSIPTRLRQSTVNLRSVPVGTHASGVLFKKTIKVDAGTPEACVPTGTDLTTRDAR